MKCTDCLPSLEEFFDGEVDEKTGERMRLHLASCADCAEAFDALRAEQELFLRYDRGLEVTPALWHGVRARIVEETAQPQQPFLLRLREHFASSFAVFSLRPGLASALALLVVGITAGALWLNRSTKPAPIEVVSSEAPARKIPSPISSPTPGNGNNSISTQDITPGSKRGIELPLVATATRETKSVGSRKASSEVVEIKDHEVNDDLEPSNRLVFDDIANAAATLDPGDEAVARHVEKAQMLLRSFKNTRPAEGEGNLAYERELSRKLLEENISLRLEAETNDNKNAKRVLSSLEPFLVDISNLREEPSRGDMRSIKDRMEKQEIIAALHAYD
jgi:hypothetical protein